MIETDSEGQRQIEELIKNKDNSIFDDWEQAFIKGLIGQKYSSMSSRQKSVLTRLYGWLNGRR